MITLKKEKKLKRSKQPDFYQNVIITLLCLFQMVINTRTKSSAAQTKS